MEGSNKNFGSRLFLSIFIFGFSLSVSASTWTKQVKTDPITDDKIIVLSQSSLSGKSAMGEKPSLVLRCAGEDLSLYVNWKTFVNNESHFVTYRVDKNEARQEISSISTDGQATFFSQPPILIREMKPANKLFARTTPYNSNPVTVSFSLSGFTAAFNELEKQCESAFTRNDKLQESIKEKLRQKENNKISAREFAQNTMSLCSTMGFSCFKEVNYCHKIMPVVISDFKACMDFQTENKIDWP